MCARVQSKAYPVDETARIHANMTNLTIGVLPRASQHSPIIFYTALRLCVWHRTLETDTHVQTHIDTYKKKTGWSSRVHMFVLHLITQVWRSKC